MNIARSRRTVLLSVASVLLWAAVACEKVPLLAPSGSSITLTSSATALSLNGTTQLAAQIISPSGLPPHSGTHVIFTTTLGTIDPPEMDTDINGRALATFKAGTSNGTASITASSGGSAVSSANALKIAIGTAAVGRVAVTANPTLIPAQGGSSIITASVVDINGNALSAASVAFSTTAGTLDQPNVTTDANGNASTTLRTTTTATVTATVGAQGGGSGTGTGGGGTGTGGGGTGTGGGGTGTTPAATGQASGSVTINVAASPTLVITPPTTPPSAGLPASFTFAVTIPTTNGSAIRDLTVNWGDGNPPQDLGAVTSTSTASHVYRAAGSYVVSATLIDTLGNTVSQSAPVTVIPVPRPSIVISPSPQPGHSGTVTTITIQVTFASGISAQDVSINFGDGTSSDLGGAVSVAVPHVYPAGASSTTYTVTVTVLDTSGQTTIGTAVVSVQTP